jgi:anti-anti-sigma regulatory factor
MSEQLKRLKRLGVTSYRRPGGDVVVRLVGPLDAVSAPRLMDEMLAVDPHADDRAVLHLGDVTDSAGVGALFYLEAFVRVRRARLVLSMSGRSAEATMTRLRLEPHFSCVGDQARGGQADVPGRRWAETAADQFVTVKEELL